MVFHEQKRDSHMAEQNFIRQVSFRGVTHMMIDIVTNLIKGSFLKRTRRGRHSSIKQNLRTDSFCRAHISV